ncbi:MAG: DUF1801 domain-containing protein [Kofleriaceae bacterium]|nr:DUF1801 domain-containing protein [Kofleriaceae bacterium]
MATKSNMAPAAKQPPTTIDAYIAGAAADVQPILKKLRTLIKRSVRGSRECLSYGVPAFSHDQRFIYFAAFKQHIGIYPPVLDDKRLIKALAPYRNAKGNLAFPLDRPMPYPLITKVVVALAKQYAAK